jgi:hypothetical protein
MRARQWTTRVVALVAAITLTGALALGVAGAQTHRQSGEQSGDQSSGESGEQSSESNDNPRTINIVGTGVVRGTPDVLDLTIGVSTRAKSAGESLSRNNELSNKLNDVLREAGVDEEDIQTSNLSIAPIYDDNGDNVIAYGVDNTVTVTIRDLEDAGKIVDAAAGVAGDEIVVNNLAFSFDDNSELVAQARTEAVKRAKAQAEQLAKAAGVELGDVLTISEGTAPEPPVIAATPREAGAADAGAPIEPGSESLTVQVSMTFKIA